MIDWDEYERNVREIEEICEEEPPVREGLKNGLEQFLAWLKRTLDSSQQHASQRNDSWDAEPYCKRCGRENIEADDFEDVGVKAFLCDHCTEQL